MDVVIHGHRAFACRFCGLLIEAARLLQSVNLQTVAPPVQSRLTQQADTEGRFALAPHWARVRLLRLHGCHDPGICSQGNEFNCTDGDYRRPLRSGSRVAHLARGLVIAAWLLQAGASIAPVYVP